MCIYVHTGTYIITHSSTLSSYLQIGREFNETRHEITSLFCVHLAVAIHMEREI